MYSGIFDTPVVTRQQAVYRPPPSPIPPAQHLTAAQVAPYWKSETVRQHEFVLSLIKQIEGINSGGPSYSNTPIITAGSQSVPVGGYRDSSVSAWLAQALIGLVRTRQFALSLTPDTEILPVNNSQANPGGTGMHHGYSSVRSLVTAMYSAVQGDSGKTVTAYQVATSLTSQPLNNNVYNCGTVAAASTDPGFPVFGWLLRITGSGVNFPFRPIRVRVGRIVATAGVLSCPNPIITFVLKPRRVPVDVIILSPSNASGILSVVPGVQDQLLDNGAGPFSTTRSGVEVTSLADANVFASIESLNQRDLMERQIVPESEVVSASDALLDELNRRYPGTQYWPGIRDGLL